MWFNF